MDKTRYENLSKDDVIEVFNKLIEKNSLEYIELAEQIRKLKVDYEQDNENARKMSHYEFEISRLQRTISDMQAQLFQERQLLLKSYNENEKLKEIEVKFLVVCKQMGVSPNDEIFIFTSVTPEAKAKFVKLFEKFNSEENTSATKVKNEIFKILIEKDKLEKSYNILLQKYNTEIGALLDDQKLTGEERLAEENRHKSRINYLLGKLISAREVIVEVFQNYMNVKEEMKSLESKHLNEKFEMERYVDKLRDQLHSMRDRPESASCVVSSISSQGQGLIVSKLKRELESLKREYENVVARSETYRIECQKLESIVASITSNVESEQKFNQKKSKDVLQFLKLLQRRYEELDQRRMTDNQGYLNELKILRSDLKSVEKNMNKFYVVGDGCFAELDEKVDSSLKEGLIKNRNQSVKMRQEIRCIRRQLCDIEERIKNS